MIDENSVLTEEELKEFYGNLFDLRDWKWVELNKNNIPEELWPLIPYSKFWGIGDDVIREDLVDNASISVRINLAYLYNLYESRLYKWLSGKESDNPNSTDEYDAFSCFGLAASLAKTIEYYRLNPPDH